MSKITGWNEIDCRVGLIKSATDFPVGAANYYVLQVNFGSKIGTKNAVVEQYFLYQKGDLIGKKVVAIVNLKPWRIGPLISEVKILTVPDDKEQSILIVPNSGVEEGRRLDG